MIERQARMHLFVRPTGSWSQLFYLGNNLHSSLINIRPMQAEFNLIPPPIPAFSRRESILRLATATLIPAAPKQGYFSTMLLHGRKECVNIETIIIVFYDFTVG